MSPEGFSYQPMLIDNAYFHAYNKMMEFTCNPTKNDTNVRERGLPLLAASVMFNAATSFF